MTPEPASLALKSARVILVVAVLSTLLMLGFWLGAGNEAALSSVYLNGLNVVASTVFVLLLPKGKTWINAAFLVFCFILVIGSKSGGFTLTTFPAYIMSLLGFVGLAGILPTFKSAQGTAP